MTYKEIRQWENEYAQGLGYPDYDTFEKTLIEYAVTLGYQSRFELTEDDYAHFIGKDSKRHLTEDERCDYLDGPLPKPDKEFLKKSDFWETHTGPTPNGGAYSTAYFFDENGVQCTKEQAKRMSIVEWDEDGLRINESHGFISNSKDH